MNNTFIRLGAKLLGQTGFLPLIESLEAYRGNLLRILVYHRIGDPEEENGLLDPTLLSATPVQFEQQMRFLSEHYRLLSIQDLLQVVEEKKSLSPKSVMVTFDDGYHDFLETAWPTLERYRVPCLMFLATSFLSFKNQIFWWDRLYQGITRTNCTSFDLPLAGNFPLETRDQRWTAFIELKRRISCMDFHLAMQLVNQIMERLEVTPDTSGLLMSWSDARWLNEQGCSLAPHTRSHSILSRIPKEEVRWEIHNSRLDICQEIGTTLPVFAYPSGHAQDCGKDLSTILREEGCKLAMTSIPGINVFPQIDHLRLKRIGLSTRITMPVFKLVLTGYYHIYSVVEAKFTPTR